jgi:hypothetical protein
MHFYLNLKKMKVTLIYAIIMDEKNNEYFENSHENILHVSIDFISNNYWHYSSIADKT